MTSLQAFVCCNIPYTGEPAVLYSTGLQLLKYTTLAGRRQEVSDGMPFFLST